MFWWLFWDIVRLCATKSDWDMIKNSKNWFFKKCNFCIFFLSNCHYAGETLKILTENNIFFVFKDKNPPSCPQIIPIENFFWILKQKVYEGNRTTNTREQLIQSIKKITDMDMDVVIRMFDRLEEKIQQAMIMD